MVNVILDAVVCLASYQVEGEATNGYIDEKEDSRLF